MKENEFTIESLKMVDFLTNENIDLGKISDAEFQILGAYIFGMLNGYGIMHKINPIDIEANLINIISTKLDKSFEFATEFSSFLIQCTDREFHNVMYTIIQRGIKGFYFYNRNKRQEIVRDYNDIVEKVLG